MTRGSSKRRKQERQQERQQQRQRRQQGSFWSDDDEDSGGDAWGGEWNDEHAAGASRPNQDVRRNGLHDWEFVTLCACMLVFCRLYRCCSR
jgi:hypothetical protein